MTRRILIQTISLLLFLVFGAPVSQNAVGQERAAKASPGAEPNPKPLLVRESIPEVARRLERDVPRMMNEADVPGVSMALIRDGAIAWRHAFGVKDSKTKEPATNETVFEAASLSKPVFAYAVLKLVDAGQFDLDKPLNQYLPGNYDVGPDPRLAQITARHVLSHTTGFPNWRQEKELKIFFTPGDRFSYSGEGFVYLSKVIEHITGEKFNDFMRRMVFAPLGMTSSSYVWEQSYDSLKTSRHNAAGLPSPQFKAPQAGAASTLHTTASDYAKFLVAVLNSTGLKKSTRALMLTPQVKVDEAGTNMTGRPSTQPSPDVSWGLGVGLQSTRAGMAFWHWGDNGDAKAYFVAFERQRVGVVMFANAANGLSFLRELIDESIGGEQPAISWIKYESYRSPNRVLLKNILAKGAEPALREFRAARKNPPAPDSLNERSINSLGYSLLYSFNRVKDAIEVFKMNVEDYPNSSNAYDSLAEAYAVDGNKELAIRNYQRSVELDPTNTNGIARLKKLQEEQKK